MGTILAVFLHFMDPIDYAGGFRGSAIEEGVKGGIGLVGPCWQVSELGIWGCCTGSAVAS